MGQRALVSLYSSVVGIFSFFIFPIFGGVAEKGYMKPECFLNPKGVYSHRES